MFSDKALLSAFLLKFSDSCYHVESSEMCAEFLKSWKIGEAPLAQRQRGYTMNTEYLGGRQRLGSPGPWRWADHEWHQFSQIAMMSLFEITQQIFIHSQKGSPGSENPCKIALTLCVCLNLSGELLRFYMITSWFWTGWCLGADHSLCHHHCDQFIYMPCFHFMLETVPKNNKQINICRYDKI